MLVTLLSLSLVDVFRLEFHLDCQHGGVYYWDGARASRIPQKTGHGNEISTDYVVDNRTVGFALPYA